MLWGDGLLRPTGHVGVSYRDLASLVLQYEIDRDSGCGGGAEGQLFLGVKIGSRPGVITGMVAALLGAIAVVILIQGIEN